MIIAVIPARGGSKGIPGKNLLQLGGRPLIAWTIEHAMESALVDRVLVATDNTEIAALALSMGAEWFIRSDESSTDDAPTEAVLREVDECVDEDPEAYVLLQCTSPIRRPDDIDSAIAKFRDEDADSLFSGCVVHGYTWTLCAGTPFRNYHDRKRRQDEDERTIEENGSIYVYRPSVLRQTGQRLGGQVTWYEMPHADSRQIDEWSDVEFVERELQYRRGCDFLRHRQHAV